MIASFRCVETRKLWETGRSRRFPAEIQRVALRKLAMMNNVSDVELLRIPPANRLEKLSGDRRGQYSIRINDKYRICFVWRGHDAHEVEIVDYH